MLSSCECFIYYNNSSIRYYLIDKIQAIDNNRIFIFSESGNLLIFLITLICIDDKANFLKENDQSIIGWLKISVTGLVFLVNLLSSIAIIIMVKKDKVKKLWERCRRKRSNK